MVAVFNRSGITQAKRKSKNLKPVSKEVEKTQKSEDVYTRITDQIIEAIEAGAGEWKMPWHSTGKSLMTPINVVSGKPYRGINQISLWAIATKRGYTGGIWATYQQWKELGAQVRKGEKAALVVFWQFRQVPISDGKDSEEKEGKTRKVPFAREYYVFNQAQVDGYKAKNIPVLPASSRIARVEEFFKTVPARVLHGGNQAYYSPASDYIQMPEYGAFKDPVD